jgi:hypothetical protein
MHLFDNDIAVNPAGQSPGAGTGQISGNWSINNLPNGGYLMALLANAVFRKSEKTRIAIMTVNYVLRTSPGPVRIDLECISASSQFERFEARLVQEERIAACALATLVEENLACTMDRYEAQMPELADLDQCIPIPQMPGFTLFDQVDLRLDPAWAGWMSTGQLAEKSRHRGWIRFKEPRTHDALSVLLMADCFPPPVYASMGLGSWVPTIELSVNIRKLPATQWLKCFFQTRFVTCGLLEEDGQIWDETGNLVAISRQIAHYRK